MDLTVYCESVDVSGSGSKEVQVDMSRIDPTVFDNVDIAEKIGIDTFVKAFGETDILDWFGTNVLCDHLKIDRI